MVPTFKWGLFLLNLAKAAIGQGVMSLELVFLSALLTACDLNKLVHIFKII